MSHGGADYRSPREGVGRSGSGSPRALQRHRLRCFFSVQSANRPRLYDKDSANANARLSAQLPYILAMSRFAHYLKAMMRDKIGSFMSRQDCERFLNQWIMNYVCMDDDASQAAKAKLPLREAAIQ